MPQPLATITLRHATLELWPGSHCRTVFPDGATVPASPNGAETIVDTVAHELAHHLVGDILRGAPSACLRAAAEGDGHRWTAERGEEERLALVAGRQIAEAMRAMARAYRR